MAAKSPLSDNRQRTERAIHAVLNCVPFVSDGYVTHLSHVATHIRIRRSTARAASVSTGKVIARRCGVSLRLLAATLSDSIIRQRNGKATTSAGSGVGGGDRGGKKRIGAGSGCWPDAVTTGRWLCRTPGYVTYREPSRDQRSVMCAVRIVGTDGWIDSNAEVRCRSAWSDRAPPTGGGRAVGGESLFDMTITSDYGIRVLFKCTMTIIHCLHMIRFTVFDEVQKNNCVTRTETDE